MEQSQVHDILQIIFITLLIVCISYNSAEPVLNYSTHTKTWRFPSARLLEMDQSQRSNAVLYLLLRTYLHI